MNHVINKHWKRIIIIAALLSLILALAYQHFEGQQDIIKQLNQVIPGAASYEELGGQHEAYKVFDSEKKFIGYAARASASGYGGPITATVGIDQEGHILRVQITDHYETPWFLERVINHGFLQAFQGKMVSDTLQVGQDLDAVSGATLSAEGIAHAVRKAAYQVGESELGLTAQEQERPVMSVESIILLILFALILMGIRRKLSWVRPLVLVTSVFALGFWLNAPLALGNFASLVSGSAPSFMERSFWYLLVVGTLLITLFLGRNIYCYWLCPFGAIQEGLYKVLPIFRYRTSPRLEKMARQLRWVLIWLALMIAFILGNPSMASFEPFSAFFNAQANTGQWMIMILVLATAVPVYRYWCRFFCPVGAVLDLMAGFKSLLGKKNAAEGIKIPTKPKGCMGSGNCQECLVNCHQTQNKKQPGKKQPLFMLVIVLTFTLIMYTLVLNISLLS